MDFFITIIALAPVGDYQAKAADNKMESRGGPI